MSKLSIIIPAYNEEGRLGGCLASVRAAFAAIDERDYEVVVCDNNSTDRTAAVAREAGARVVFEPHNQIARARNRAAKEAGGEWLVFLDADSELPAELLQETVALLGSGCTGAGGALVGFDTVRAPWHGRAALGVWNFISRTCRLAAGSYIFCQRDLWEESGGFDETLYAGEELDLSRALKRICARRGLRFRIIRRARVRTSARKIDEYSPVQIVTLVARLLMPGARKRREACDFWYKRGSRQRRDTNASRNFSE